MKGNYTMKGRPKGSGELTAQIKLAKQNNSQAIEYLLSYYEPKIQSIISYFTEHYNLGIIDEDDLRQQCYIGILNALKSDSNFTGIYYICMVQCCQQLYYDLSRTIRIPAHYWYLHKDQLNDLLDSTEVYPIYNIDIADDEEFIDSLQNQIINSITIEKCKSVLSQKYFDILYLHNVEGWTFAQIGLKYNITRNRVMQIEHKAILKCTQLESQYSI